MASSIDQGNKAAPKNIPGQRTSGGSDIFSRIASGIKQSADLYTQGTQAYYASRLQTQAAKQGYLPQGAVPDLQYSDPTRAPPYQGIGLPTNIPTWVWFAGGAVLLYSVLKRR